MTYKVRALCSSGAWGIATLDVEVEYNGDINKFHDDAVQAFLRCGYTAILHFLSINECESAKVVFNADVRKYTRLCDGLMARCAEYRTYNEMVNHLKESAKNNAPDDDKCFYKKDVWRYAGGWTIESASREAKRYSSEIDGAYFTLKCMGVDVDDTESKTRILTNLGFYNVP